MSLESRLQAFVNHLSQEVKSLKETKQPAGNYVTTEGLASLLGASGVVFNDDVRLTGAREPLTHRHNYSDLDGAPTTDIDDPIHILTARLAARSVIPAALVFTGSSTTAGSNATTESRRYVNQLVARFQSIYPAPGGVETAVQASSDAIFTHHLQGGVHGYNAGQGGTRSIDYLTQDEITRIGALNPAMVLHMIGANDFRFNVDPLTYKARVITALDALDVVINVPCLHVLVHTYQRYDTTPMNPWKRYGQMLAEIVATRNDAVFVDLSPMYERMGVPGNDLLDLIDSDLIHQKDSGHALMADLLWRALVAPVAVPTFAEPVGPPPDPEPPGGGDWLDSATGVIADFDASTLTGSTISEWPSKRGSMAAPVLMAEATAPALQATATPAGTPAVRWTRDVLGALRTTDWPDLYAPMSFVWVLQHVDTAAAFCPSSGDGTGPYSYISMLAGGATANAGYNTNQFSGVSLPGPIGNWMIIVMTGSMTSTLTATAAGGTNLVRHTGPNAGVGVLLGGISLGTNGSTNVRGAGRLARFAILNRELSEAEVTAVISNLRTKYGI